MSASVERRAVGRSRETHVAASISFKHGSQEEDLGVEPLIDLALHETMQHEGYQDRGDDQRGGNEYAGSDHEAPAKRSVLAHHRDPELSL
ncbi:hypothetical protein [Bradyrhizobium sp. BRP22]|uniref:hypothetical protein n=1 Tax=Bradyrhizobium sp. BRP22 TaxID=2793821 RepID=UPI001CD75C3C|nr:hypothetical protein [Bradyrhizobium sp. BRP22]